MNYLIFTMLMKQGLGKRDGPMPSLQVSQLGKTLFQNSVMARGVDGE